MKRTGAQIVWESLRAAGTKVVFGYPGGQILPTYDAQVDYEQDVHHVLVRHEQGASHAADGYSRAAIGKVGVCMATSGPGATNLVTGIATAQMDSSPLVAITGQVAAGLVGLDAFQETDITGITLPITKHNVLVTKPDDIARSIKEAFYIAQSGRPGPVLVDVTRDAQAGTAEFEWDTIQMQLPHYRPSHRALPEAYARAAEMIHQSKRPVILLGHGALISGAMYEVRQLAEKAQVPVALTLLGIGALPASHPLCLGMMGMHGEAWVNYAIQEADLLIAVGMRFDDRVTGRVHTYAPNAKKIHIEIDRSEINKVVKVDVPLVGDAREVLEDLLPCVLASDHSEWLDHIAAMRDDALQRDIQSLPHQGRLHAAHVINDLWRITGGNAVIVSDVGQHQMWAAQYYRHETPNTFITTGGLGTMGFGLPAAMGVKFARPDKEVWVICGDGSFQMTQCELATLAQEGVKVNVAIINNSFLGMVRQWQELFYGKRYSNTPMLSPDFVKIAEAHGHLGLRVTRREDVEPAVQRARESAGTTLIDFRVEKEDVVYPMVPAGGDLHAMIRRPLPEHLLAMAEEAGAAEPEQPQA